MFDMLKTGLEDEGFKQNTEDLCIFVRNKSIVLCYVGYCCIFFKDKDTIDALLKNLLKKLNLTDEGCVKSYLGMNVRKDPNGTITMSQPAVIDKTLNSLGVFDEWKIHDKPENVVLTKYDDGNGRKQEWHYRSVIFQMNYLSG